MAKKLISQQVGRSAIETGDQAMAVRYLLQLIEQSSPGGAVELRVPPFGAVQCLGGVDHRRGTPPNVVELGPESFLELALGRQSWDQLVDQGRLRASGVQANQLRELFPVLGV